MRKHDHSDSKDVLLIIYWLSLKEPVLCHLGILQVVASFTTGLKSTVGQILKGIRQPAAGRHHTLNHRNLKR